MASGLTFRLLGAGPVALMAKLLLLLLIGVPLMLFRCTLAVIVGGGVVLGGRGDISGGHRSRDGTLPTSNRMDAHLRWFPDFLGDNIHRDPAARPEHMPVWCEADA